MSKVTFAGAGSRFTMHLARDIILIPGIGSGTFAPVDRDAERLALVHRVVEKVAAALDSGWQVVSSRERTDVLGGAIS